MSLCRFWDKCLSALSTVGISKFEEVTCECHGPEECPDELEKYFTISTDKADVYHGHTPTKKVRNKKPKYFIDLEDGEPLEIDIFLVLRQIDKCKTKDFK